MRSRGVDVADTKSSPVDIVTEADRACEELILDRLLQRASRRRLPGGGGRRRPEHVGGDLGRRPDRRHRELPLRAAALRRLHRCDPRRMARSWPGWCAARSSDVEYAATLGGGATRNGVRLRVPDPVRGAPPLGQALVATGFSYEAADPGATGARGGPDAAAGPRHPAPGVLCPRPVRGGRGPLDAYVEEGAHLWDYAAGGLVATEAGATFEVWNTIDGRDLVVCAPAPGVGRFLRLGDGVRVPR